jgi:hypothetical protein
MSVVFVELDGAGYGPVPVDLGPVQLPGRAGVLLDAHPWPDFVPAGRFPADAAARSLAESSAARVLVACPALVSPGRSLLALAVGRLLADERASLGPGPVRVVMCAVRPRCPWESGGVVVPHLVSVLTGSSSQSRVVWEIADGRQVAAAWRAGLEPDAVWPVAVSTWAARQRPPATSIRHPALARAANSSNYCLPL